MRTRNNKNIVTPILIVLSIALVALLFSYVLPKYFGTTKQKYIRTKVPTITSSLSSTSDYKEHTVITNFTVDLGMGYAGKITPEMLKGKIAAAMATLDYETVNGPDGLNYIKENVKQSLTEAYQVDAILDIYVTDIDSGTVRISNGKSTNSDKNSVLGKIFPGMNR